MSRDSDGGERVAETMRRLLAIAAFVTVSSCWSWVVLASETAAESAQPKSRSTHAHPPHQLPASARQYYQLVWGVDIIGVKPVSSGAMIRFSYRIVDAEKAKVLNDKKSAPFLFDQKHRAKLVVPSMEKVGQLRQSSTPEDGREYWMLFSNKGSLVQPGSRVDVVIGKFRAEGLIVQSD